MNSIRARLTLGAALGAGALVCGIGLMATSGWLISRANQQPPVLYLMVAITAVRTFGLGRGVLRYTERLASHDAALRLLTRTRVAVFDRLADLAPGRLGASRTLGLVVTGVDGVADRWLRGRIPMFSAVVAALAALTLQTWLLPEAGLVLLASLALGGVAAPLVAASAVRRATVREARGRDRMSEVATRTLHGLPELVAYGAVPDRLAELEKADAELDRATGRSAWSLGVADGMTLLSCGAAVFGALALAVPAARAGDLDPLYVAVLALTPLAAFEAVTALSSSAQQMLRSRADDALLARVLDAEPPVTDPDAPTPLPHGVALRVRDLRVRWPDADRDALDGLDLDLPPGRKVAVFGASGAGKSTLAAALLRFTGYTGSITLDGVELADLAGDDVRRVIGLCAQDAHVFDTTVAENVRLARPGSSDAEVAAVLRRAGLDLPLDRRVGEHGAAVSGGERQRIALARALLADFPVLILDEPDAHLDEDTADRVLADLLAAAGDRTVLLITHRPGVPGADPVLRHVDEVITLTAPEPADSVGAAA
ncbi:thiol reductant ABC exporter subunit CydC [Actinocorallia sp. A-T 12471]|uniref:thiol reductant ABC exporter subunit CydC n=1 Tax=Actinocorallia sp. A-T 12471 TaxID=3089813 RepID=UPI0029D10503|nr:thiol reductant ABC exporter subunit CydC [Actinocorallia sp. A-T 12471]MDX6738879.1 thiol reductant ABC exporter subunit CydC [Actinocorallia sp. A-T 12471]